MVGPGYAPVPYKLVKIITGRGGKGKLFVYLADLLPYYNMNAQEIEAHKFYGEKTIDFRHPMGKGLHHPLHQCFIPFLLERVDSHSKTRLSQVLAPVQHSVQERKSATECTDWSRINPDLY